MSTGAAGCKHGANVTVTARQTGAYTIPKAPQRMTKKPHDPTLDHEAVLLVRKTFRFCPNFGYRKDIIACGNADMKLWQEVVAYWKKPFTDSKGRRHKNGHNPLAWGKLLAEFDGRFADKKTTRYRQYPRWNSLI